MHILTVFGLAHGGETEDERKEGEEGSEREARHYGCLCVGPGDLQFSLFFILSKPITRGHNLIFQKPVHDLYQALTTASQ